MRRCSAGVLNGSCGLEDSLNRHYFTSESVTEGHPDKVADQISDAILDGILDKDPNGRVAVETLVTTGMAFVAGEVSTKAYVEIPRIIRSTIRDIGYVGAGCGFDYETCAVVVAIDEQSPDIAMGVDTGGAGDQGMMFGYATRETEEYMPMPIHLAHALAKRLAVVRKEGIIEGLGPDGKTQVTVEYDNGNPVRVETVVVSTQHSADVTVEDLRDRIKGDVVDAVLPKGLADADGYKLLVNPTGAFVKGGPAADCGLTGRKIIVDTYGGVGSHGGGAFSGKDPTKVDRSASYAARHVAKNLVAAGIAERCEIQFAYAIGVAEPVSVMVDSKGTGIVPDDEIARIVRKRIDLRPKAIIERLHLRRPIYLQTAAYGHFGRSVDAFTWERLDLIDDLKRGI